MKNFFSKLAIFNVYVIINGCKNVVLKNADFVHIWPNFCQKFADDTFWHLATVTLSASRLCATSNRLPLQILNEPQVTTSFPLYTYILFGYDFDRNTQDSFPYDNQSHENGYTPLGRFIFLKQALVSASHAVLCTHSGLLWLRLRTPKDRSADNHQRVAYRCRSADYVQRCWHQNIGQWWLSAVKSLIVHKKE
jgi:hypothetical protein